MDSTVSVIDLNAKSELTKIVVGKNPGSIVTDHQGDVYVISRGNYSTIPSRMKKIDQNRKMKLQIPELNGIFKGNRILVRPMMMTQEEENNKTL
jgi:hypothetical protein